ncbi:hypothetical protein GWI33_003410, partial [Rhynchophorus ferrugineus]
ILKRKRKQINVPALSEGLIREVSLVKSHQELK